MGDAEPHHDVLQVQHMLVPLLGAGAAQGAGTQHMVSSDVPARDRMGTELPELPAGFEPAASHQKLSYLPLQFPVS